jgi:hypothetical protein
MTIPLEDVRGIIDSGILPDAVRSSVSSRIFSSILAIVVLVSAMSVLVGAGPAVSDTWQIEIASDATSVSFPDEIEFDLVLDSEVPVREVVVHYRVARQDVVSYAYPDWEQGDLIRARFTLPTSGSDYIPPGTEIEYYYTLRDGADRSVETPRRLFTYEDTRFTWQATSIDQVEIYWHGGAESQLALITPTLETTFERIGQVLQVQPSSPFRGLIYNSQNEAAGAFPPVSATLEREQLFAGYAFPEKGVFLGVEAKQYLIAHEVTHLYTGELLGAATLLLPTWVEEGLAVYMQIPGQTFGNLKAALEGEDLLPLRAMQALPGQADQIRLFYSEAPAVVAYLLEVHGDEKFRDFLYQFRKGATVEEALDAAYGFGVEELDALWRGDIDAAPEKIPLDTRFWAVTLPSIILTFVMLLAAIGYGIQLYRRARRNNDSSLTPPT